MRVGMVHPRSSSRERSIHLCSIEHSSAEPLIIDSGRVSDDDFEDYSSYHPLQIKLIETTKHQQSPACFSWCEFKILKVFR